MRRYEKTIRFATITSVKAGWLVKSGGSWSLTEEGRQAYRSFSDPEAFEREAVRGYRAWEKEQQPEQAEIEETSDVADSTGTLEEAQDSAWAEIRAYLTTMPPYDFQRLVAALLKAMGYYVDWIAPPGPDGGIDLIAHTDPLGTTGPRIKVQVKASRHREGLGREPACLHGRPRRPGCWHLHLSGRVLLAGRAGGTLAGEASFEADRPRALRRTLGPAHAGTPRLRPGPPATEARLLPGQRAGVDRKAEFLQAADSAGPPVRKN